MGVGPAQDVLAAGRGARHAARPAARLRRALRLRRQQLRAVLALAARPLLEAGRAAQEPLQGASAVLLPPERTLHGRHRRRQPRRAPPPVRRLPARAAPPAPPERRPQRRRRLPARRWRRRRRAPAEAGRRPRPRDLLPHEAKEALPASKAEGVPEDSAAAAPQAARAHGRQATGARARADRAGERQAGALPAGARDRVAAEAHPARTGARQPRGPRHQAPRQDRARAQHRLVPALARAQPRAARAAPARACRLRPRPSPRRRCERQARQQLQHPLAAEHAGRGGAAPLAGRQAGVPLRALAEDRVARARDLAGAEPEPGRLPVPARDGRVADALADAAVPRGVRSGGGRGRGVRARVGRRRVRARGAVRVRVRVHGRARVPRAARAAVDALRAGAEPVGAAAAAAAAAHRPHTQGWTYIGWGIFFRTLSASFIFPTWFVWDGTVCVVVLMSRWKGASFSELWCFKLK